MRQFFCVGIILSVLTTQICFSQTNGETTAANRTIDSILKKKNAYVLERYVPARVLTEKVIPNIPREIRLELKELSQQALVKALKDHGFSKGISENFLKMRKLILNQSSSIGDLPYDSNGDQVKGLTMKQIESLVETFPESLENNTLEKNAFSYSSYRIETYLLKKMSSNDLYNFRVAAMYFINGYHEKYKATFNLFPRGKEQLAYFVETGQDEILDNLKYAYLSEEAIQHIKKSLNTPSIPESFWEYLRKWRWKGEVRAVPVGTINFANYPMMQFISDAVSAQIIESFAPLPIADGFTTTSTKAARIKWVSGRVLIEGGTRRSNEGLMTSMAAYYGGADHTSNVETAMMVNQPAVGTQNHASVMMFDSEAEAYRTLTQTFKESSLIIDTHDIIGGLKNAFLVMGKSLTGFRVDSPFPGKTAEDTYYIIKQTLEEAGLSHVWVEISRESGKRTTYSDKLEETTLATERMKNAPFNCILVGSELAKPSSPASVGFVYKLAEIKNLATGETIYQVKKATGKPSMPAQQQIFRVKDDSGKFVKYILGLWGENTPSRAEPLLEVVMQNGKRTKQRKTIKEIQDYVMDQMKRFPVSLLDINTKASNHGFPLEVSAALKKLYDNEIAKYVEKTKTVQQIAVIVRSHQTDSKEYEALLTYAKFIKNLDDIYDFEINQNTPIETFIEKILEFKEKAKQESKENGFQFQVILEDKDYENLLKKPHFEKLFEENNGFYFSIATKNKHYKLETPQCLKSRVVQKFDRFLKTSLKEGNGIQLEVFDYFTPCIDYHTPEKKD